MSTLQEANDLISLLTIRLQQYNLSNQESQQIFAALNSNNWLERRVLRSSLPQFYQPLSMLTRDIKHIMEINSLLPIDQIQLEQIILQLVIATVNELQQFPDYDEHFNYLANLNGIANYEQIRYCFSFLFNKIVKLFGNVNSLDNNDELTDSFFELVSPLYLQDVICSFQSGY